MTDAQFNKLIAWLEDRFDRQDRELQALRAEVAAHGKQLAAHGEQLAAHGAQLTGQGEELGGLREQLAGLRAEFKAFRDETREKLENVSDRLTLVEKSQARLAHAVGQLRSDFEDVRTRLEGIESTTLGTNMRILELRDDMQQRFRVVNERLASVA